MEPAKDCPLLPQKARGSLLATAQGRLSPVTTILLKKPLRGPLFMSPPSADASALLSFIPMAGLLPPLQQEFLGALRSLGESGREGGTPRDVVVLLQPPPILLLPPRMGGQAVVNDDDSIIGACGGLGQTNAEQMRRRRGGRLGHYRTRTR